MDLALVAIEKKKNGFMWLALIGINLIYACTYVCMKKASAHEFMSSSYILWIIGAICVMGLYALLWQQILSRTPLATAYMFKGTSLIFVLLLSALLFNETITITNLIGAVIIIIGITIYAKS